MVGNKEEYRDKGIQEVYDTPYEEKLKKWPWIRDKRIKGRFLHPEEENKIVDELVCLRCGKKCKGECQE